MAAVDLRASKTGYLTLDQYFFGHTDKYGTTHGSSQCGNQTISLHAIDAPARWRGDVV